MKNADSVFRCQLFRLALLYIFLARRPPTGRASEPAITRVLPPCENSAGRARQEGKHYRRVRNFPRHRARGEPALRRGRRGVQGWVERVGEEKGRARMVERDEGRARKEQRGGIRFRTRYRHGDTIPAGGGMRRRPSCPSSGPPPVSFLHRGARARSLSAPAASLSSTTGEGGETGAKER